jgi:hypothetical protein
MKIKNKNKYFIFTNFIIFLLLCINPSIYADSIQSNLLNVSSNKINIFKIDPNGRISPVNILQIQEEQNNIDSTIKQKLDSLFKDDKKLQQFINTNNVLPWVEVESKGYGLHKSFRKIFLSNRTIIWRSVIKYRFFNDSDYTKGRFKGNDEWMTISGSQHIRLIGFIGYVSFKSNVLLSRFKIHEIIIHGYTLRIDKLK